MKGVTRAMNVSVVNKLKAKAADLLLDRKLIIRISIVIFILLTALLLRVHENGKADISVEAADEVAIEQEIYVDIGGAIKNPGVYKATTSTRLYEVIEMAGGLRSDADTDSINQAAFVEDGQKIIIPIHYQEDQNADDDGEGPPEQTSQGITSTGKVNINTASKDELMTLTGIGEVMAERIIEYRTGSRFNSIEDIKSVKGIGDATYEKIKDNLTL